MPKENNMYDLAFPPDFCSLLDALRVKSNCVDKEQVRQDIYRKSKVYIGSHQEDTRCILEDKEDEIPARRAEIFFKEMEKFPLPFQNFIYAHFHQGGQLYTGIRFLDVYVLSKYAFSSRDVTREFIFELKENQLCVEEVFRVRSLQFLPLDDYISCSFNPASKEDELFPLSESQKTDLKFLRSCLEAAFDRGDSSGCSLHKSEDANSIRIDDISTPSFVKNDLNETALIEFRVKHRVSLDSSQGSVSLSSFEEKDFSVKAHKKLLNPNAHHNKASFFQRKQSFSKLFSPPELTVCRRYQSLENRNFHRHISDLAASTYYQFVFLILNILLNYVNRPFTGLSSEQTERFAKEAAFQSSFAQRMRA